MENGGIALCILKLCEGQWSASHAYQILAGKAEGKGKLGRPRCWWEDNFKIDVKEVWRVDVDCTHLAQDWIKKWAIAHTMKNF